MERLYVKPSLCKLIKEYCDLNGIEDINNFANRCATQGFNIAKYGLSPPDNIAREANGIKDLKEKPKPRKKKEPKPQDNVIEPGDSVTEVKPPEEKKQVVVRKIRIIKKDKND